MSRIIISIVICTHNRADLLRGAIRSVLEQKISNKNYELIVIDNNSSDSTRAVVEEFSSKYAHVRYIVETNIGLSHARNLGWKEARGKYIGFLDDDCKVASGWLSNALRVAKDIAPHAFGGPVYAFYNSPKPAWFKDEYGSVMQGDTPRVLTENEYLDGNNMFILRDLLVTYAGFHPELGMKGKRIAYGEETYFFKRLHQEVKNSVLYYDPSVFVYHLVRAEKMKLWSVPKRFILSGIYWAKIQTVPYGHNRLKLIFRIVGIMFMLVLSLLHGILARNKMKQPYLENYLYEITFRYFNELGFLIQKFRSSKELR